MSQMPLFPREYLTLFTRVLWLQDCASASSGAARALAPPSCWALSPPPRPTPDPAARPLLRPTVRPAVRPSARPLDRSFGRSSLPLRCARPSFGLRTSLRTPRSFMFRSVRLFARRCVSSTAPSAGVRRLYFPRVLFLSENLFQDTPEFHV